MTFPESPFRHGARREFHVSRRVRDAYGLEQTLFSVSGNVVFADFRAARDFSHRLNERRDSDSGISASEIYALGLIDEALHLLVARHRRENEPQLWSQAITLLEEELGSGPLDDLLAAFVEEFPPTPVYNGEASVEDYLAGATDGEDHREATLEELVLVWLANRNPAFGPFRELFDDEPLRRTTAYDAAVRRLESHLASSKTGGPAVRTLLDLLLAPVRAAPDSLQAQLEFIRTTWADLLGPDLHRVLGGLDFLVEEQRVYFPPGPGPVKPPDFRGIEEAPENFSADCEWMPRLVLLAKNARVWLAQLSSKYDRPIMTLDGIPDEELETLAGWGMTGLWLIGVWERSRASERIKRRMGDDEAVASAYSLEDYRIAEALGGEEAYEDLRGRAWKLGIRLSTDMVPNHMGIDSRWMIEHPDWFVSLDHSPFPAYTFDGPDLSDDERVGIFIEDHYWHKSDAAVVFKRLDRLTGDERYVYHGNDGTSMPWNDTAQLDYLRPEVREAVIQTILAVARRSPVIRFDAAMTLTRGNYHRLWFPEPGAAGAIPSRAEHGLSQTQFDEAMPREFWREVVDRVAEEAPDTLLLAEAFWLLEGYFVRTLGMHRVYNSAFMNMLRDERNAEYRQLIRSTLEFDPQILKRYVNFMSNPDERTAVDQFGTGDKYFGVATLMATMPGLPMLGHGQIEGLTEKYGMEFYRPRLAEAVDDGLVGRHEFQLFPLLRRRHIFAEVDQFLLYDFERPDGSVDENVFAYSNEIGGERSLVVYHNRYDDTRGRIRLSTAVAHRTPDDERTLVRKPIGEGLGLSGNRDLWVVFRDSVADLEYLRSCTELGSEGLFLELGAYQLHCFLDFREVADDEDHPYGRLASDLDGRGVQSIDEALGKLVLSPILDPVRRLLDASILRRLSSPDGSEDAGAELLRAAETEVAAYLEAAADRAKEKESQAELESSIRADFETLITVVGVLRNLSESDRRGASVTSDFVEVLARPAEWATVLTWMLVRRLGDVGGRDEARERAQRRFNEWYVGSALADLLTDLGEDHEAARRRVVAVELMLACAGSEGLLVGGESGFRQYITDVLARPEGHNLLGVHRYDNVRWFNREAFEELVRRLAVIAAVHSVAGDGEASPETISALGRTVERLLAAAERSKYRVDDFLEVLGPRGGPRRR